MADVNPPNYPDILGYITKGQKASVSVVQAALTVHPHIVPAGRPFEALLLLQNASDVVVDVHAVVHLPEHDVLGHKEKFVTRSERLVVTLRPAEVGYLVLPLFTLPDTAPGDYKLAVEVRATPLAQPRWIRRPADAGEINLDYYFYLTEETTERLLRLRNLSFVGARRSLNPTALLGKAGITATTLEAGFSLNPGQIGKLKVIKPGWVSLWSLSDGSDARALLERHTEILSTEILPKLNRRTLFKPLSAATGVRLKALYPIQPLEITFISKLLLSVVEAAWQPPSTYDYAGQEFYHVKSLLDRGWPTDGSPIPLPNWCRAFLPLIGMDEQVMKKPAVLFAGPLYEDLLRDAVAHGFGMLSAVIGQPLGSDYEVRIYGEYLVEQLRRPQSRLTFLDIYLPLVLGGICVANDVPMPGEEPFRLLQQLHELFQLRSAERNADNASVFDMADQVAEWALRRYRDWA